FDRFDRRTFRAARVRYQDDLATACGDLLHVRYGFLEYVVVRRNHNDGHCLVDQSDRPVLEFTCGVALGVDIRNFLELERALERDREPGTAAEVKHVRRLGEVLREPLDLRLERESRRHQTRCLNERMYHLLFVGSRKHAARTSSRNGKASERA